jgi:hypothetical protein
MPLIGEEEEEEEEEIENPSSSYLDRQCRVASCHWLRPASAYVSRYRGGQHRDDDEDSTRDS